MTVIILLFALALVMFTLEIFLPGGILGVFGVCVVIGACVLAFRDYGTSGGLLAVVGGLVMIIGGLVVEFVVLPKTRFGKRFFLDRAVTGTATAAVDGLIGHACEAMTVLAPSGMVLVDGRKLEAFCRDGYAERGARLVVRGSDNFRLIVSKS